jgi:hypothetical protein
MIKKGLLMASAGVSLEGLMDYEIEASLARASVKKRQTELKDLAERKKTS